MRRRLLRTLLVIWPLATLAPLPASAGQINVAWDPVAGASGYHVYYGSNSGTYDKNVTTATNAVMINGLQDCKTYFVAVKAFNAAGEDFSRFARRAPGMFFSLSVTPPGVNAQQAVNHSPLFEGDDAGLPIGVRLMSTVAMDYLRGWKAQ